MFLRMGVSFSKNVLRVELMRGIEYMLPNDEV